MTTITKASNRLANEKSPYLLQHAHNPVDWYPWVPDAFYKAKKENKPIFLSIGYSTCHWCHVMERESFEDEEVAKILNENYVSIKVDREERPDLDNIYMSVCMALTGHGGWPLTVIMTPEKKPFFAGTYFPKESRYGLKGLREILLEIKDKWVTNKEEIVNSGEKIAEFIQETKRSTRGAKITPEILTDAYNSLEMSFDEIYGGFGSAPKFPTPHTLMFLLRYYNMKGEKKALKMVVKTLESMYKGGIYDHIGFGFSRYSTDHIWLIPHFEKMLYDNALLAIAYLETFQITGNELFKRVAEEIFTYILRDMISSEGGFYSAEDADSEGVEGKFYVWTPEEIKVILGEKKGEEFCDQYNITRKGNFEGKSIPNLIKNKIIEDNEVNNLRYKEPLERIFEEREKRVHPHKDDKILTSWNALMIVALAKGGRILQSSEYVYVAEKAYEFILKKLVRDDGRLLARYRDGEAAFPAYVDDYAFLVWALLELYETTFDIKYLDDALKFNNEMLKIFWDTENGGLYFYGNDSEELIVRQKEIYDGAIPSGNSVATLNFLRLARITGDQSLEEKAHTQFEVFSSDARNNPSAYTYFLMSFMFAQEKGREVVIVGDRNNEETKKMLSLLQENFLPFTTNIFKDPNLDNKLLEDLIPFTKEQNIVDGKTTAYVCENYACQEPLVSSNELEKTIKY